MKMTGAPPPLCLSTMSCQMSLEVDLMTNTPLQWIFLTLGRLLALPTLLPGHLMAPPTLLPGHLLAPPTLLPGHLHPLPAHSTHASVNVCHPVTHLTPLT